MNLSYPPGINVKSTKKKIDVDNVGVDSVGSSSGVSSVSNVNDVSDVVDVSDRVLEYSSEEYDVKYNEDKDQAHTIKITININKTTAKKIIININC